MSISPSPPHGVSPSRNSAVGAVSKYALAVLCAFAALFLREVLSPFFATRHPYHTVWLAVAFCAWYCGVGPSIVAVVIDAIGIWYWFVPPVRTLFGKDVPEVSGMLGFLVFSAIIIAFGESTRRGLAKLQRTEELLRKAHEQLEDRVQERTAELKRSTADALEKATLLDLANDAIFVKTAQGKITYWNRGAEKLYGWTASEALGQTAGELLRTQYPISGFDIEQKDSWEGELPQTTRDGKPILVQSRWTTLRDEKGAAVGWMEINTDITQRKRAEEASRTLSARLLTLQDDERRRMARGLHDSLGQYLAALKMHLDMLADSTGKQMGMIAECSDIAGKCLVETRTVSHLLHPPLLDEAGFSSAAQWFVEGFAQRSGFTVNLELPPEMGRLNSDVEIALFRALQEGLTNVHRHSGGSAVDIRLTLHDRRVQMEIQDNGHGISHDTSSRILEGAGETGIGIAGMRERVKDLGGVLEIESDPGGTILRLTLPLSQNGEMVNGRVSDERQVPAA